MKTLGKYVLTVTRESQNPDGSWNCLEHDVLVRYIPAEDPVKYDDSSRQICDGSDDSIDILDDAGLEDITEDEINKLLERSRDLWMEEEQEVNDNDWRMWMSYESRAETTFKDD